MGGCSGIFQTPFGEFMSLFLISAGYFHLRFVHDSQLSYDEFIEYLVSGEAQENVKEAASLVIDKQNLGFKMMRLIFSQCLVKWYGCFQKSRPRIEWKNYMESNGSSRYTYLPYLIQTYVGTIPDVVIPTIMLTSTIGILHGIHLKKKPFFCNTGIAAWVGTKGQSYQESQSKTNSQIPKNCLHHQLNRWIFREDWPHRHGKHCKAAFNESALQCFLWWYSNRQIPKNCLHGGLNCWIFLSWSFLT